MIFLAAASGTLLFVGLILFGIAPTLEAENAIVLAIIAFPILMAGLLLGLLSLILVAAQVLSDSIESRKNR